MTMVSRTLAFCSRKAGERLQDTVGPLLAMIQLAEVAVAALRRDRSRIPYFQPAKAALVHLIEVRNPFAMLYNVAALEAWRISWASRPVQSFWVNLPLWAISGY